MILGNVSIYNTNGHRQIGAFGDRNTNYKPSTWNNSYSPDTTTTSQMSRASYPTGTQPPYSWLLAPKGGEMSATTTIGGSGAVVGAMSMGKTCTADLSGSGTLVGSMALVSSMLATLSGSGGITANLSATISMIASLAGSGSLAGSLGLRIPLSANLSGSGTITANLKGNADMSAHIYVNSGSATTQELVDAIWNALASSYNVAGTMGEAVQTGGGGGGATAAQIWSYATRTLTESAGLSTEEHNKLFSLENSTGGGGFINYATINNHTTSKIKEVKDLIAEIPQVDLSKVEVKLNEIDSHNSLAKDEIINTIKETETEVCSDIVRSKKELKEDNLTTRQLVRGKAKKLEENTQKLADRQDKIDKIIEKEADEIEASLEEIYKKEADTIESELEDQYKKEADKIESEINS